MGSDHKTLTIGETCHVTDGAHSKVKRQESGILYLTSKNIKVGTLSLDKVDYISEADYEKLFSIESKAQRRPKDGDVLIGIIGTFGNAYRYKKDDIFGISSSIAIIRPDAEILDSDFLYYVVTGDVFKAIHSAYKSGSVQGYTNIPTIKELPLPIPPLPEQKAIANILGSLDDKIELNRQMNETLEAMAQALFKSWFVDFDPVIDNALAASNAIPDEFIERAEQRKAIEKKDNSDIQQLFPDEFEFTEEMGWIPKGWDVKKAEEIASITIGKTPPRKEPEWFSDIQKDNLVWVSIRDMGNSNVFIGDSSEYLTKESIKKFNVRVIPKNSVILSFKLTLGRVLIAQKELATNEAIAHFCNPKFSMSKEYVYCYLSNFKYDSLGSTSSIATAVNSKIIKAMPFIVPSELALSKFETLSKMYFDKISLVNQQIDSLTKLRDTLLPQLMSGELRIPDAAALVYEVL
ncbi:restriction endonuclease subunit S [Psychrobacter sp.]|uniref:restriction endonuclease subunit S n=1 Tax=Psychrobacter sp. TaxID=56811 RepID=UPI003564A664